MSCEDINVTIEESQPINVTVGESQPINVSVVGGSVGATGPQGPAGSSDHTLLSNLDYASAGHTGFASSSDLAALDLQAVTDVGGTTTNDITVTTNGKGLIMNGGKMIDYLGIGMVWENVNNKSVVFVDDLYTPLTTNQIYLGSSSLRWKNVYSIDGNFTGNVTGLNVAINEHAYFDAEFDNGDSGASDTVDWGVGNKQKSTLTASTTYTFTAPDGVGNFLLHIINDGTGGYDITWPATVKFLGTEPTWTDGGANKTIIVTFYYDGTDYWAQGSPWEA